MQSMAALRASARVAHLRRELCSMPRMDPPVPVAAQDSRRSPEECCTSVAYPCDRHARGVMPVSRRNTSLKWLWEQNPK